MNYYCKEYSITENGMIDGKIVGHQLTFSIDDPVEMKKNNIRFVKVKEADDCHSGESRTVEQFEKKYKVKAIWCEIDLSPGITTKYNAYVINPDLKYFKALE